MKHQVVLPEEDDQVPAVAFRNQRRGNQHRIPLLHEDGWLCIHPRRSLRYDDWLHDFVCLECGARMSAIERGE